MKGLKTILLVCVAGASLSGQGASKSTTGWESYNGDPQGRRFSPLTQINTKNVSKLKLAWTYGVEPPKAGGQSAAILTQAVPILVRGILYTPTAQHSIVALDPATGKEIWKHDLGTVGAPNRGVSYWAGEGKLPARILRALPGSRKRAARERPPSGRLRVARMERRAVVAKLSKPERFDVASREDAHQLLLEVVARCPNLCIHAVFVHLARAIDVLAQPLVQVEIATAQLDLVLVVELDLAHQETRQPASLVLLHVGRSGRRRTRLREGPARASQILRRLDLARLRCRFGDWLAGSQRSRGPG